MMELIYPLISCPLNILLVKNYQDGFKGARVYVCGPKQ